MNDLLILITLLGLKHFIADFPLQPPFMWKNKGTWGHPGGIAHAGVHALFTYLIFALYDPINLIFPFFLAMIDFLIHYVCDWSKMNLNKHFGLTPTNSAQFWNLVGLDQFVHHMTYVLILFLWASAKTQG